MRIETPTGLVYDDTDPLCSLVPAMTQGAMFAFVTGIDTGHDGQQRDPVRYWGRYEPTAHAETVGAILADGAPWPKLPAMPKPPEADSKACELARHLLTLCDQRRDAGLPLREEHVRARQLAALVLHCEEPSR